MCLWDKDLAFRDSGFGIRDSGRVFWVLGFGLRVSRLRGSEVEDEDRRGLKVCCVLLPTHWHERED